MNLISKQTESREPAKTPTGAEATPTPRDPLPGQRHGTLTLSPCRNRPGLGGQGPAYGAQIECGAFVTWLDDPSLLGVVAYVLNVGTVRLQLPALADQTPRVQAFARDLPVEVIALSNGVSKSLVARQNEQAAAQFVKRFVTSLRCSFGNGFEPATVVDWYRQKLLPAALKAVPNDLQVNTTLRSS